MISEYEINEILRRAQVSEKRVLQIVQDALYGGKISLVPSTQTTPPNFAGGTNLCPNSDFSFSHLAATVPGTSPSDATDPNKTIYRAFRQAVGANISATGVRTSDLETDTDIPCWDKTYGVIQMGSDTLADNHDIAIQFTQNWAIPAQTWYIRIACATIDDTPVPDGLRIYAGLWGRQLGGAEGWIESDVINITAQKFYVPGASTVSYKVVAKTDTGLSIESQLLTITDAPAVLDANNYIRVDYSAVAGFVEFFVYKQVGSVVTLISYERNSTNLRAYDTGQTGQVQQNGFPTASLTKPRAYAEVEIDARPLAEAKIFNNLTLKIPTFDTTLLALEGTFLRIGLLSETAIDRQIVIDTIWAGTSFNRWSVSPSDNYQSLPSVSITTGIETGGQSPSTPPLWGGGNSCVASWMDLMTNDGWVMLEGVREGQSIKNGTEKGGSVKKMIDGEVSQYYVIKFSNNLVVPCTFTHHFVRSLNDGSGISSCRLQVGDTVLGGGYDGELKEVTVTEKKLVEGQLKVRAVKVAEGGNLFYAVGSRRNGAFVYCHNRKEYDDFSQLLQY
jgi:hypothetical protein